MSRMVEARLPRMISSVMGSTIRGARSRIRLPAASTRARKPGATSGVASSCSTTRGPVDAHARREPRPRIARGGEPARAAEVDAALARPRVLEAGARGRGGGFGAARQGADRGHAEVHQLDGRAREIVGVEAPVLGVKGRDELGERPPPSRGPSPAGQVSSKL